MMTREDIRLAYLQAVVDSQLTPNAIMQIEQERPGTFTFLDVRGTLEETGETIPGAIVIPLAELEAKIGMVPSDRTVAILPWSPICILGKKASIILLNHGYDCIEIVGGIQAWKQGNHPLEKLSNN